LSDRAAECGLLRSAIEDAVELLDSGDPGAAAKAHERLLVIRNGLPQRRGGR